VLGCHADGVDGWWTNMLGAGYRVITPARFGYFGSTLPPNATPADQADAYALLLDHLGVGRAAVIGYSAGSASVLELALHHPDRVLGLVLANCRLGGPTPNPLLKPVLGVVYGSQRLFWLYRRLLPSIYARMLGVPKGYRPTSEEAVTIRAVSELQFPLRPRKAGAVFDGFVSNLAADRFPLEQLTVPTLIVSAADDPWARHPYAVTAAARIPGAKLVTIDRGGHLFLGHDTQVRAAIGAFLASVAQPGGRPR
jgi:pimeloyl-ACP methyl ester carboxylesterase